MHHMVPNYILVGHAALVFHAAKNTIRMAALSRRADYRQMPWGLVVSTKDLADLYPLREQYHRTIGGHVMYDMGKEGVK